MASPVLPIMPRQYVQAIALKRKIPVTCGFKLWRICRTPRTKTNFLVGVERQIPG
jgi:hypothetical protein